MGRGKAASRSPRLPRKQFDGIELTVDYQRTRGPALIQSAHDWPAIRLTRNRLVHEYFERPDAILPALKRARDFVDTRCAAHHAIRSYAQARFAV